MEGEKEEEDEVEKEELEEEEEETEEQKEEQERQEEDLDLYNLEGRERAGRVLRSKASSLWLREPLRSTQALPPHLPAGVSAWSV